jgi:hypothetical protein
MYERAYTPGLYDLILGMLRDAGIVPNVSQAAADLSTVISLVDAHMGIVIASLSAVKNSAASVVVRDIVDKIPVSEIGIAVRLKSLGHSRNAQYAKRS